MVDALKTRSGRKASQRADELLPLIGLIQGQGARSYLEIGARHGDTWHEVMRHLPVGSIGVAVDLPGGRWGTTKSAAHLREAREDLRRMGYRAHTLFGDSGDPGMIERVAKRRREAGGLFDAALIDGDHLYAGVSADWRTYGAMARLVAFHDVAGHGETTRDGQSTPVEVPRLWAEIRGGYRSIEIVGEGSTMGFGVIWPGEPARRAA